MQCNNCHKRHYVTSLCRYYFGGKKYDVYDCAFRVILQPSQNCHQFSRQYFLVPTFFPPKFTMLIHFGKSRYGLVSFIKVHTGKIYVYVVVVVHCMAGVLSYLLGC